MLNWLVGKAIAESVEGSKGCPLTRTSLSGEFKRFSLSGLDGKVLAPSTSDVDVFVRDVMKVE